LVAKNLIHFLEAVPVPFTPNGDDVNDVATITYDIANLTSGTPVSVKVFDLTGRLRRVVHAGLDASGRYTRDWDGKDDNDQMLAPGIYLVCVEVEADTGSESKTAIVPLVY
jgi:flagellar hook assembly protein FlgD